MKKFTTASRPRSRLQKYILRLYVSTTKATSAAAITNLTRVCELHLKGRYDLEVIDITRHANLAREAQIVAVPTLVKRLPAPLQRLVGDMSDVPSVLLGLGLGRQEH